jgi:hypothetical protein
MSMELSNFEMIYQLEHQISHQPKWAREERCEYCECCKSHAADKLMKFNGVQLNKPVSREPKRVA